MRYDIGDFAQGGVIIWLTTDGKHGLVAAIEDLGSFAWSTQNVNTPADNKQPLPLSTPSAPHGQYYPGYQNQQGIIGIDPTLTAYPAFQACENYSKTINGVTYNDWFLPSTTELSVMYSFADLINQVSIAHGGSAMNMNAQYWSSLEDGYFPQNV